MRSKSILSRLYVSQRPSLHILPCSEMPTEEVVIMSNEEILLIDLASGETLTMKTSEVFEWVLLLTE